MTPNTPNQRPDPVDQVLAALAHAAPPTGMEQRILQSIEAAQLAPAPTRPSLLSWQSIALSFAVAAILITIATLHDPHSPLPTLNTVTNSPTPHLRDDLNTAKVGIGQADGAGPVTLHAHDSPAPHLRDSLIVAKVGIGLADCSTSLHTRQPASAGQGNPESTEAVRSPSATQPTLVSFPAPPMPITAQERLLLRLAHRDDPQALAALTPENLAAQQTQDNAAFQDFFPPFVPVEYPTLLSQSNPPVPVSGAAK